MTRAISLLSDFLLTAVTISFILGIGLSCRIEAPLGLFASLTALSCLVLLVCFFCHQRKSVLFALLLTFILLGILHGNLANRPPVNPSHIYNIIKEKREAVVIGNLASMVNYDGETSQALITLQAVRFVESPDFLTATGTITVRMKDQWPTDILPGMRLTARADLQRPSGFRTPGSFDYPASLARQDIWITGFIRSPAFLHRIEHSPSFFHSLRFFPEYLRHTIGVAIDKTVTLPLQGVYRALLIGDQTKVDDQTRALFRDSGCMHILSISGLHFAIIGSLLFFVVYWLLRRSEWLILHYNVRKIALFTCLPPLCFYAMLAGMNIPVFRSLIMSCTAILALCTDRRKSIAALLSFAALLILLVNPQSLFTISFQLSFAAIAAIALATPGLALFLKRPQKQKNKLPHLLRLRIWFLTALAVSVAATLGTAPLLLMNFNQLSLVGPLANLVVEPLICLWSLPLALLSCLTMPFSAKTTALLLQVGAPGLELSLKSMELFNALPLSSLWLATPHPLLVTAYYISLLYLVWSIYRKRAVPYRVALIFCLILFLFVASPAELAKKLKRDLTVTFLDVGQGSATLVEFPGGYRLLIDGGGATSSARGVGESVIAPFLWQKGITSIDQVIITHPDADHYNGIPFIIKHFSPSLLWTNTITGHDRFYSAFIEEAIQEGVLVILPEAGMRLPIQNKAGIRCFVNWGIDTGREGKAGPKKSNDSGLIVQARFDDFSVFFPGDISIAAEEELLKMGDNPISPILLAPHHGSKTSNSPAFLRTVQPRYLIVSAGRSGSRYFPHPGLEDLCNRHGITLLTTARSGTIEVVTDGKQFSLLSYSRAATGPLPSGLVAEAVSEKVRAAPTPPATH